MDGGRILHGRTACIKHHIHENMELYSSMIKNTLFGNDST